MAEQTREERLAETNRRWHAWAVNAKTDMPPDFYAGELLPDGTVATDNLWRLDGELVDEDTYAASET